MHLLSAKDLNKEVLFQLIDRAKYFDKQLGKKVHKIAEGKILATLFYEPSTRTRLSFETSMLRLGGTVISTPDMSNSSAKKGETLKDTGRIVSGFADIIAMRHYEGGAVLKLSEGSTVPVINAGDGSNEHPTQVVLDIFTIIKEKGTMDGLKIALVGDLKFGRTVHSMLQILCYFDVEVYLVSPDSLKMPKVFIEIAKKNKLKFIELTNLSDIISEVDVLYQTRVQQERFASVQEYESLKDKYVIDKKVMSKAKKDMILMHPLPRIVEITEDVDLDSRAIYFKQAKNGIPARMAVIEYLLNL